ncbi:uncharacterized protein LOC117340779 isoform X2 [Pecten maximus]|uniref:uncharacterized protein LOC117340779 isoform X2 n=1 Tax=Pecten maximus TaxID=6579 RepID=UPI00145807BD|nr:uncharacterized protein LOC117340779 isoform X2 [Pecten maximus]
MDGLAVFIIITGIVSQAAGLFLTIEPHKIQYIGGNDVTIRCGLGKTDIETVGWMQISKQTLLMEKRPYLLLRVIDGTGPEWSSGIDDEKMDEKASVSYSTVPLEETYLEFTLHQIECDDGGVYSCEVSGTNQNGSVIKEHIREELIVYSFGQEPTITYFSAKVPNQELIVDSGSEVTLLCNGLVGKPSMPITWYQYNAKAGAFTQVEEGVSQETLMVEKNSMCSYNGSSYLTFTASGYETEVTFRCGIGQRFDTITVITTYTARRSFNRIFGDENVTPYPDSSANNRKEKGLLLSINPSKVQYQGDFDVTIKCSIGDLADNLTEFGYIQIQKEGPVSLKRPYLTLRRTNGTGPEWGTGIDRVNLESKSTVTYRRYPLEELFIQVTLHRMECDDEGIYTCALFGIYNGHSMEVKTKREELSIYTYAGEPQITVDGQVYPSKVIHAYPGTNLTLTCSGPVGKPQAPIQWYKYNMMSGAYIYTTTGTKPETIDLPIDHLCRYTGTSTMTFLTTTFEQDVTYECKIGAFADIITVIVDGGSNGPLYSRQKQLTARQGINIAEFHKGSRVLCLILAVLVWFKIRN